MNRFVATGWATLLALVPAAALACVGLPCADPWALAPGDGGSIPANAPALALTSSVPPWPLTSADAGVVLVQADGGAIDLDVSIEAGSTLVLRPRRPLPALERFELRYPDLCREADAGAPPHLAAFFTTDAQPAPTTAGQLTVEAQGHGAVAVNHSTMCGTTFDGAYAQLKYQPSDDLLPWLPLTGWRLLVDGKVWAQEELGAVRPSGLLGPIRQYPSQFHVARRVLLVHAWCAGDQEDADLGIGLGKHTAQLEATVLGLPGVVSASADFDLECLGTSQPPSPIDDQQQTQLPVPRCSCSAASAPGPALALLALALRRRRIHSKAAARSKKGC